MKSQHSGWRNRSSASLLFVCYYSRLYKSSLSLHLADVLQDYSPHSLSLIVKQCSSVNVFTQSGKGQKVAKKRGRKQAFKNTLFIF